MARLGYYLRDKVEVNKCCVCIHYLNLQTNDYPNIVKEFKNTNYQCLSLFFFIFMFSFCLCVLSQFLFFLYVLLFVVYEGESGVTSLSHF